uniref:Uncharacterized protein n=1 Tax=Nelumbo nucifera TaxID=4432 RepID=A0A822ZK36_NELNU|nr:TPA_asm: hypothetical protein HUJ06_001606 [Nelumbo nucifera]
MLLTFVEYMSLLKVVLNRGSKSWFCVPRTRCKVKGEEGWALIGLHHVSFVQGPRCAPLLTSTVSGLAPRRCSPPQLCCIARLVVVHISIHVVAQLGWFMLPLPKP